jgi:hypothetical protein
MVATVPEFERARPRPGRTGAAIEGDADGLDHDAGHTDIYVLDGDEFAEMRGLFRTVSIRIVLDVGADLGSR